MAITVVQSGQTAGAANNTSLTITAASAGDTLASFFSQTGLNAPTCSGFLVNATSAVYNGSLSSLWVATKIAAGGETSIAWTAGSGGTGHGVAGWELAGAASAVTLDGSPVHTDNIGPAITGGLAVTTTVNGSIILLGVGGDTSSGAITAWTGTNVATNINTAAARCFGGSFITTTTVSSTFTANWTTSHAVGMLAITLQPPSAATPIVRPFVVDTAVSRASSY